MENTDAVASVRARLFALQDEGYAAFQCRLMPTVNPATVIGVRMPALRALAKELRCAPEAGAFLAALPHAYYEENNLHGFLLENEKDFARAVELVDAFLPYVDNWATCDLLSPKVFRKRLPELYAHIQRWIASDRVYTVRFGIEMLMSHFLDDAFTPDTLELPAGVRSGEYYVNMMIAWYFATALAKQWDAALPYLTECRLETWTHNKTIQKAIESYRITPEQKEYLRTLKIK